MKFGKLDEFHYWNRMVSLREIFRESIRFGLTGREEQISAKTLSDLFSSMQNRVDDGIQKALVYGRKIIPTYFTYRVTEFETDEKTGEIEIKGFEATPLPCFLEAPAKLFGWLSDEEEKQKAYHAVRASGLFDQKLNMKMLFGQDANLLLNSKPYRKTSTMIILPANPIGGGKDV